MAPLADGAFVGAPDWVAPAFALAAGLFLGFACGCDYMRRRCEAARLDRIRRRMSATPRRVA